MIKHFKDKVPTPPADVVDTDEELRAYWRQAMAYADEHTPSPDEYADLEGL